jgi:hypothetical protein
MALAFYPKSHIINAMETVRVAKTTDKVETGDDDSLNHVPNAVTLAAMQETEDNLIHVGKHFF